jgi:hypothetical protein
MNITSSETYQSPIIMAIDIAYEGVVCSSNELLEETEGEW